MSQTITEKVGIGELTKYGFKSDKGEYINWGPRFTDKVNLTPGKVGDFTLYVSDGGKKYVNAVANLELVKTEAKGLPKAEPKPKTEKKEYKAKDDTSMSKDEWAAKDRRISRQGCIQVAVQVTNDFDEAVKLATKMLEFVNS